MRSRRRPSRRAFGAHLRVTAQKQRFAALSPYSAATRSTRERRSIVATPMSRKSYGVVW